MLDGSPSGHFYSRRSHCLTGSSSVFQPQVDVIKNHPDFIAGPAVYRPLLEKTTVDYMISTDTKTPPNGYSMEGTRRRVGSGKRGGCSPSTRGEIRIKKGVRQRSNGQQWRRLCDYQVDMNGTKCDKEAQKTTAYCSRHLSNIKKNRTSQGVVPPLETGDSLYPHHPPYQPPHHVNFTNTAENGDEDSQDSVFSSNRGKLEKGRSYSFSSMSDGSSMSPGMPELVAANALMSLSNSRTNTPFSRTPHESPEMVKLRKKRLFGRHSSHESNPYVITADERSSRSLTSSVPTSVERLDHNHELTKDADGDDIPEELMCTEDCDSALAGDFPPTRSQLTLSPPLPTPSPQSKKRTLDMFKCINSYQVLPNLRIVKTLSKKRAKIERDVFVFHRSNSLPDLTSNVHVYVCQDAQPQVIGSAAIVSPVRFTEKPQEKMLQPNFQTKTNNPKEQIGNHQDTVFSHTNSHQPLQKSQMSAFNTLHSNHQFVPDSDLCDSECSSTAMLRQLSLQSEAVTPPTQPELTPPPSATPNGSKHDTMTVFQELSQTPVSRQGTLENSIASSSFSMHHPTPGLKKMNKSNKRKKGKPQRLALYPSQPQTPTATQKKPQSCRTTWPSSKSAWCNGCKTKKHGCERLRQMKKDPSNAELGLKPGRLF